MRQELEKDGGIQNWFGGLVDGMRDANGQIYMRNRYCDPHGSVGNYPSGAGGARATIHQDEEPARAAG